MNIYSVNNFIFEISAKTRNYRAQKVIHLQLCLSKLEFNRERKRIWKISNALWWRILLCPHPEPLRHSWFSYTFKKGKLYQLISEIWFKRCIYYSNISYSDSSCVWIWSIVWFFICCSLFSYDQTSGYLKYD